MREYGNPLSEDSTDTLVVLHNGNLKTGKSVENLSKIEEMGEKRYEAFVKEKFVEEQHRFQRLYQRTIFSSSTQKPIAERNNSKWPV